MALELSAGGSRTAIPFVVSLWSDDGHWQVVPISSRRQGTGSSEVEIAGSAGGIRAVATFGPPQTILTAGSGHGNTGHANTVRRLCRLQLANDRGTAVHLGARIEARLGPEASGTWLVPGLFYGENRWPDCERTYPRFDPDDPDPARMESDAWSFRCDRAATTVVFAWDAGGGTALWAPETGVFGENGLGFALEGGHAALRLHFPFREEPVTYDGSEVPEPPAIPTALMEPGQAAHFDFEIYHLPAQRHSYAVVLRHLWERPLPGPATSHERRADVAADEPPEPWCSLEDTASLTAWGLYRWHYRAVPPVLLETAAFDRHALGERGDRQAMHVSWVSGVPYAYALLLHATRTAMRSYREAALAVIDHTAGALAPSGTFWSQWQAGAGWSVGWTPHPDRLHCRTLADATLFTWRALAHEKSHGAPRPAWARAVTSNLDAACRLQRADGALPSAISSTGSGALDWRGSAGLAWVAPLAEAGHALGDTALVEAAVRAGHYFARNVEDEYLCGAPEDVDLAPTSEDGYLAVMSYMALYRATGDRRWVALARRAAEWMLTFRYSYNVSFPEHTILGHYRYRSRGADQASPPNQHLHIFGLACQQEMAELSDATGDAYYLERAKESLACARQFVARQDADFGAYRGMVTERFYQTTCFQAKGMLLGLSHAWSVGILLLACEEAIASARDWGP